MVVDWKHAVGHICAVLAVYCGRSGVRGLSDTWTRARRLEARTKAGTWRVHYKNRHTCKVAVPALDILKDQASSWSAKFDKADSNQGP